MNRAQITVADLPALHEQHQTKPNQKGLAMHYSIRLLTTLSDKDFRSEAIVNDAETKTAASALAQTVSLDHCEPFIKWRDADGLPITQGAIIAPVDFDEYELHEARAYDLGNQTVLIERTR